ncbi:MAG TPA: hypothetical protein VJ228_08670, partial [Candidatus Acidoferrales bacterium]|nr:hypothetical protein [Candidatus Acidoferrales bacterium]
MNKAIRIVLALSIAWAVYAADVVVSAAQGAVEKVDSASKTIVVKTADGTETHSITSIEPQPTAPMLPPMPPRIPGTASQKARKSWRTTPSAA